MHKVAKILEININTNYAQFKFYDIGKSDFKKLKEEKKEQFLEIADYMGFLKETFEKHSE